MKRLLFTVFLLLVGCSYSPSYHIVKDSFNTNTYAPSHASTYAPVYTPVRTPTYVPIYPTRQVYGSPQKIKKVKKYKAVIAGGTTR